MINMPDLDSDRPNNSNVLVTGGDFNIVYGKVVHKIGGSGKDIERSGLQLLQEHIAPDAFHNSRERSREVNPETLKPLVQKWSSRLHSLLNRSSTSSTYNPVSSFATSSPDQMEPNHPDEIIKDVFTWLFDQWTPFLIMWIHDESPEVNPDLDLVAQAVARILHQLGKLSASFFRSGPDGFGNRVDCGRVIPSLAYQLAQNVPATRCPIANAVLHDSSIFNLEVQTQVKKLLLDPILTASKSGTMSPQVFPYVLLVHGLERFGNEDHFPSSFLHELADILSTMKANGIPHRLLVFGKCTRDLQKCVSKITMRQIVLQRPLMGRSWFGREREIGLKEEQLRSREQALHLKGKEIETREERLKEETGAMNVREVDLRNREKELKKRGDELKMQEDNMRAEIKIREQDCDRNWNEFKKRGEDLKTKEDNTKQKEAEMKVKEQEFNGNWKELKKWRDELKGWREELETWREELKKWKEGLKNRDQELKNREQMFEKRDEELKNGADDEGVLKTLEEELKNSGNKMENKEDGIKNLEGLESKRENKEDGIKNLEELESKREELNGREKGIKLVEIRQRMVRLWLGERNATEVKRPRKEEMDGLDLEASESKAAFPHEKISLVETELDSQDLKGGPRELGCSDNNEAKRLGPQSIRISESKALLKPQCEALFDYEAKDSKTLGFKKGDILFITDKSGKWWEAETEDGRKGGKRPVKLLAINNDWENVKETITVFTFKNSDVLVRYHGGKMDELRLEGMHLAVGLFLTRFGSA